MNKITLSNIEKLELKRKIRKRKRKRLFFVAFILIMTITCGIFVGILYKNDGKLPRKKLNLNTLETPEYVDTQFINLGFARTGVELIEINNIVIHYVGNPNTSAQNNRDYFNKIDTDVCAHFVIGLDGEIIQCVPLNEKSNASNNRNLDTISIEVCHPDSTGKFNDTTYNSLVKLTAWLCDNSDLKAKDVIRHYDITGKECPKYFVDNEKYWFKFLDDVKIELNKY